MFELSFKTVLIANRGEIACRLIETCRRLNLKTIAVYSDVDIRSRHVLMADESVRIGGPQASDSYMNIGAIIEACKDTEAEAVLPGYGFLSEDPNFAQRCADNNITYIGPSAENMRRFSLKHCTRQIAADLKVPIPPGSPLIPTFEIARLHAERIGYPVMVKSTSGGGGIGVRRCDGEQSLQEAFEQIQRMADSTFGQDNGVYIEKCIEPSRHIEIQVFGNGKGKVVCLGERECSIQRRQQKIIEETPSPFLTPSLREAMCSTAQNICEHIKYTSLGTVEFVVDITTSKYYLLEVNTRLQVEHGVTEMVSGVDLVEWMLRLAGIDPTFPALFEDYVHQPYGHSIECRVYAEDPAHDFKPSTGVVTELHLEKHSWARYDNWISLGTEMTSFYDPLLMKVIVFGDSRPEAIHRVVKTLSAMKISGFQSNIEYLLALCQSELFTSGETFTKSCDTFMFQPSCLEVLKAGMYSTVQDWPGRQGLWSIGVPPSGPMDHLSLRAANRLVGNQERFCGIEMTAEGVTLHAHKPCTVAITGAIAEVLVNSNPVSMYQTVHLATGDILCIGKCSQNGLRTYLAVAGGFDIPHYLGSASTFTLGKFGGLQGRKLTAGDMLPLHTNCTHRGAFPTLPKHHIPILTSEWNIGVIYGPHGAPDFFTNEYIDKMFASSWTVHHNSNRLGVRLIGPTPLWARKDGGEAGLHPSNIHDCEYAVGTINFTGDSPVIIGVDGPSLGGFVCPVTIVQAELWKIGQVKPGDTIRFVRLTHEEARQMRAHQNDIIDSIGLARMYAYGNSDMSMRSDDSLESDKPREFQFDAVLDKLPGTDKTPAIVVRAQGDANVLIEYGDIILDINLRLFVWVFMDWIAKYKSSHPECGLGEVSPGVRSVQVQYDTRRTTVSRVLRIFRQCTYTPSVDKLVIPCRKIRLPIAFDDHWTQDAIDRYVSTVTSTAPYVPSNIDFTARINGLQSRQDVLDIILRSTYLIMGLGDVYLNSPCAVPIDPRHRLVTSKYNPTRTYTPEGCVGLGGAYLCIYGMHESPGGYQLVGRTLPIWNRFSQRPHLFNYFDKLQFYQVSDARLDSLYDEYKSGQYIMSITEDTFDNAEYHDMLKKNAESIEAFRSKQQSAFHLELCRWEDAGIIGGSNRADSDGNDETQRYPDVKDASTIDATMVGTVWKVLVKQGDAIKTGQVVAILESMKMEFSIQSAVDGLVKKVLKHPGQFVNAGDSIIVYE